LKFNIIYNKFEPKKVNSILLDENIKQKYNYSVENNYINFIEYKFDEILLDEEHFIAIDFSHLKKLLVNLSNRYFGEKYDEEYYSSKIFDNLIHLKKLIFKNLKFPLNNSLNNLTNLKELIFDFHYNKSLGDSLDKLTNLEKLKLGNNSSKMNILVLK